MAITLSALQSRCTAEFADWFGEAYRSSLFWYLAGYAGSGKTTILPYMIERAGLDPSEVAFCAPTGKAAKVMTKKLQALFNNSGLAARTIHSWIYVPLRERVEMLRERILDIERRITDFDGAADIARFDEKASAVHVTNLKAELKTAQRDFDDALRESHRSGPSFMINPESLVREKRLIVVDEGSMVGQDIAEDLLSFGIPIMVMGDPGQLPPVGDKAGFTDGDPDFFLDEIHRQAADNPIIRLSMDIRSGKLIKPCTMGDNVRIVRKRGDLWTLNPDYDAQVLCGTHRLRWDLTAKIREMCGYTDTGPMPDEPLLVCKNSRKAPALVNGTFVTCIDSPGDLEDGRSSLWLTVEDEDGIFYKLQCNQGQFEEHLLRQKDGATANKFKAFDSKKADEIIDWGWVITVHKSQGSQWDNVIVHDESGVFRQDAEKWLYTGVTRAANELTLVLP